MTQPPAAQRLQGPSALAPMKESARRAQLRRTSQQFEAVLVTHLLESMNKTTMPSGMFCSVMTVAGNVVELNLKPKPEPPPRSFASATEK